MFNRAGGLKRNMSGEAAYDSFVPSPLPPSPSIEMDAEMIDLLVRANKQLAALEGIASHIPNMPLFVSMYVRKEALMSSQIEGTQATLEDVLDPLLEANINRNVADVVNYIKATDYAVNASRDACGADGRGSRTGEVSRRVSAFAELDRGAGQQPQDRAVHSAIPGGHGDRHVRS